MVHYTTGAPRLSLGAAAFGNFNLTFTNAAAKDTKSASDKELMLVVERHGNVLENFDVVDGDRKVAEVRESIQHNKKLALTPSSRRNHRPVLDVIVTPGVDLSLVRFPRRVLRFRLRMALACIQVAVIAIIASDSAFGSESN